jgi:hypothetical protein
MANDNQPEAAIVGCVWGILTLFIQFPLFCCMLYGVLDASQAPTWVWVLFWIYLPVGLFLGVIGEVFKALTRL